MKNEKKILKYKNRKLNTVFYCCVDKHILKYIRDNFYSTKKIDVIKSIMEFYQSNNIKNIIDYYLLPLMNDCVMSHSLWSINEVLESDDLMGHVLAKINHYPKVYKDKKAIIKNFKTVLRISGKGFATKVTNYPYIECLNFLKKYCVKNYLDFSCGWGVRMLSAIKTHKNYYGLDPNYKLTKKLVEIKNEFEFIHNKKINVNIKTIGSEIFIDEYINMFDLAFTSPPYFTLENYKYGKQSINNKSYNEWLKDYVLPTIKNIYQYLIPTGLLAINIKNISNFNLYDDWLNIAKNNGFELYEEIILNNITRISGSQSKYEKNIVQNNEKIMILYKKGVLRETIKKIINDNINKNENISDMFD